MPSLPVTIVDAFTDRPFAGNPAAVVRLDAPAEPSWMQAVASEMNLSETAFLTPMPDVPGRFGLRWFTPAIEVELCGHATLASAHVLWAEADADRSATLRFDTRSGLLTARRDEGGTIWLDFPALPPEAAPAPDGLLQSLGLPSHELRGVARSRFDWLVEVPDEATLLALAPDMAALARVEARGVIVTARAERRDAASGHDFLSRFFAPRAGVPEDPVTGSAHCVLAPFWARRLGKTELLGYQASRRGGVVETRLAADRVLLGGHAVTTLRGRLESP
jgi:PhzF family phenazine biosynthesis protein